MKWQKGLKTIVWHLLIGAALVTTGYRHAFAAKSLSGAKLAILQIEDPAPADAQKIDERYFTGESRNGDCAYYQLLLNAQSRAEAIGADVLKIVSRTPHSRTQHCDGIEVAFYHSGNPRSAEQSFAWNEQRPLTWNDFRGGVRRGAEDNIAAETSCGIAIETNLVGARDAAKVYVFNTFDKQKSWVRNGYENAEVLQHEQGHWDICELYTRRMQERFDAANITGTNLHQQVARIFNDVNDEYLARQEQYEQETQHGIIASEQQRWTALLEKELHESPVSKL
jgi:hypothetical protein